MKPLPRWGDREKKPPPSNPCRRTHYAVPYREARSKKEQVREEALSYAGGQEQLKRALLTLGWGAQLGPSVLFFIPFSKSDIFQNNNSFNYN